MPDSIVHLVHEGARERGLCFSIVAIGGEGRGRVRVRWHDDPDEALALASEWSGQGLDAYFGLAEVRETPPKGRGTAQDVAAITCVWIDLDCGERDSGRRYPPDLDAAAGIAGAVARPTGIVASGRGLHAYWMLAEPVVFGNDDDRLAAAALVRDWQARHRIAAAAHGWEIDTTSDLPRILRVTGTMHHRSGRPVEWLDGPYPGVAYRVEELRALAATAQRGPAAAPTAPATPNVAVGKGAEPVPVRDQRDREREWLVAVGALARMPATTLDDYQSWLKIGMALHAIDPSPLALSVWDHASRRSTKYAAGDCAEKWATFDADRQGGVGVGTLVHLSGGDVAAHAVEEMRAASAGAIAPPDRAATLARLRDALAMPLRRWIRRGREDGRTRYYAVLDNGKDIRIGGGSAVLDRRLFAAAVYEQADLLVPAMKGPEWMVVAAALGRIVEDESGPEECVEGRIGADIESYLDAHDVRDDPSPAQIRRLEPFMRDGFIHVASIAVRNWTEKNTGRRCEWYSHDLTRAGWERVTIATRDGTSRSYYRREVGLAKLQKYTTLAT